MENKKEKEKEKKKPYSPTFNYNTNPITLSDEQEKIKQLLFLTSIKLFGKQEVVSNILLLKPDLIHNFFQMLKMDIERVRQKLHLLLAHEEMKTPKVDVDLRKGTLDETIANITKTSSALQNLARAYQVLNTFFTLYFKDKENIVTLINNISPHSKNNNNIEMEEIVDEETYCSFN